MENKQNQNPDPLQFREITSYSENIYDLDGFDSTDYETFEEMDKDPILTFGKAFIVAPLSQIQPKIVETSGYDVVDQYVEKVFTDVWDNLLGLLWDSIIVYGFAPFEILYKRDKYSFAVDGQTIEKELIGIKRFKDLYPPETEIKNENGHYQGIKYGQYWSPNNQELKPEKSIVFSLNKKFGNFYGRSLYKNLHTTWRAKRILLQSWNKLLERRGMSVAATYYPEEYKTDAKGNIIKDTQRTEENRDKALKVSQAMISGAKLALPSTVYKVEKPDGTEGYTTMKRWNVDFKGESSINTTAFEKAVNHRDTYLLRGLLIPDHTITKTDIGALSEAQQKGDMFLMSLEKYSKLLFDHINHYIIPDLVRWNFADVSRIPILGSHGIDPQKRELVSNIVNNLFSPQMLTASGGAPSWDGIRPNIASMLDAFDIPYEDESEKKEPVRVVADQQPVEASKMEFANGDKKKIEELTKKLKRDKQKVEDIKDGYYKQGLKTLQKQHDKIRQSIMSAIKGKEELDKIRTMSVPYMSEFEKRLKTDVDKVYKHGRRVTIRDIQDEAHELGAKINIDYYPQQSKQTVLLWIDRLGENHDNKLKGYINQAVLENIKNLPADHIPVMETFTKLYEKYRDRQFGLLIDSLFSKVFDLGRRDVIREAKEKQ